MIVIYKAAKRMLKKKSNNNYQQRQRKSHKLEQVTAEFIELYACKEINL